MIATLLIIGVQVAFASISTTIIGSEDSKNKKSKYSLNNLGSYSRHYSFSLSNLKAGLQFRGTDIFNQKKLSSGTEMSSMLRFDKGNTTYIMPYKFKVKVPKFKTPSAVN